MALSFAIWNESTEVALATLSPFWKTLANGVEIALTPFGLLAPILVWLWFALERPSSLKVGGIFGVKPAKA